MKAHAFDLIDGRQICPTALILQIVAKLHESKLKDDGIILLGCKIVPAVGVRVWLQSDYPQGEKQRQQIGAALTELGFCATYWGEEEV